MKRLQVLSTIFTNFYCLIEQKQDKILMIMLTDTISDPWAMMVHSFDTGFANFTMVSSCLLDIVAFLTPTVLEQMTHLLAMNR
jgi:hypothetical protein